jgi:hypothetical protein
MFFTNGSNCNHCNVGGRCSGASNAREMANCSLYKPIEGKFKLADLALSYPTSLNKSLSSLPFKCSIVDYEGKIDR